jgi:hypothetical protein
MNLICMDAETKALRHPQALLDPVTQKFIHGYERLEQVNRSFNFIYGPYSRHCLSVDRAMQ